MSHTLLSYTFEELAQGNAGIIIRTNKETEISIQLHGDKTLVLFPFGNVLESPESVGHLSTGVVALQTKRGRESDSQPVAAGEQEDSQPAEDRACPCLHTEPCQPRCTCVNKYSSRGCSFCCSYGSKKQQVVRAEHLRQLILLGIQTESASSPQSQPVPVDDLDERVDRAAGQIADRIMEEVIDPMMQQSASPQSVWEQAILIVRTQAGLDIDSCRELIEELEAARDAQENK